MNGIIYKCTNRENNKVYILWNKASPFYGNAGGRYGHCSGSFTGSLGKAPFFDTGTLLYPFVTGIHIPGKIVVGNGVWRGIHANTSNFTEFHTANFKEQFKEKIAAIVARLGKQYFHGSRNRI